MAEVSAHQAVAAMALDRYRRKEGRYPDALDQLVPVYLAQPPLDSCSGEPLKYRLSEGGKFLLYSVGWNEVNDGGIVTRKERSRSGEPDLTRGDWVWAF
jgi:hypothetical protein